MLGAFYVHLKAQDPFLEWLSAIVHSVFLMGVAYLNREKLPVKFS
jgi:hypothetical protein